MGRNFGRFGVCVWLYTIVICLVAVLEAEAGKMYSYVDDQGNIVATDRLDNVPERYRARAKVTEVLDSVGAAAPTQETRPSVPPSAVKAVVLKLAGHLPKALTMPGMTAFQSVVLIGSFLAGIAMMVALTMSDNPGVKLLMKFLLVILAFSATYLMYFSEVATQRPAVPGQPEAASAPPENLMQQFKEKRQAAGQKQQERLGQIESAEPTGKEQP